jgi:predicted MPP superfamily phosphohydrolase
MFFFRFILLFYLVPAIYVYLRLLRLFQQRKSKIIFSIGYIALILTFPLTEYLSHSDAGVNFYAVIILGYCTLPYMLYLFLAVLLRDILLGVNRIFTFFPREKLMTPKVRTGTAALLVLIPAFVVILGRMNYAHLAVDRYKIEVPRKNSQMKNLKIILASDFHLKEWTDPKLMEKVVDLVNAENADILLLAGDLLEGDRQNEQLDEYSRQFRRVKTRFGIFGIPGNHDRRETNRKFFISSHITILRDSIVLMNHGFILAGRNDERQQKRKPIDSLLFTMQDSLPIVVMDHRPTDSERISLAGADILVSGHSHHGQLWPINYITESVYELSWGYKKVRNMHFFVTSGVQVWGPPVRTVGKSEVMVIDARFE